MTAGDPPFTVGIEEEYLLVDRQTRDIAAEPPAAMIEECRSLIRNLIRPELLRSQIEVGTRVCHTIAQAREELAWLRRTVAGVAARHGLAPIAASTHPFSEWQDQRHTDKKRYNILARDLQAMARRLLICGMHVHVGIDDDDLRIDLINQACYFLPHLLALSTSSPFWRGEDTGLKSYRVSVFNGLPRTGLPEYFESFGEYRRHVKILTDAGLIKDGTLLWWDIRASDNFPTIEMRITDVCTRLDDAVAVAALFVCVVRMLYRLRRGNQRWRRYSRMLINENRWRAHAMASMRAWWISARRVVLSSTCWKSDRLIAEDPRRWVPPAGRAHPPDRTRGHQRPPAEPDLRPGHRRRSRAHGSPAGGGGRTDRGNRGRPLARQITVMRFLIAALSEASSSRPIIPPSPDTLSRSTARMALIWALTISTMLLSSRQLAPVAS